MFVNTLLTWRKKTSLFHISHINMFLLLRLHFARPRHWMEASRSLAEKHHRLAEILKKCSVSEVIRITNKYSDDNRH